MTAVQTAQALKQTRLKNAVRRGIILTLTLLILGFGASVWQVIRAPAWPRDSSLIVNDVSQLNPIRVSGIVVPTTTEEIVAAVQDHPGPVAIGGARHSMGGQVATEGALHIDMRHFNQILEFSPANKTITVQAGATWRQIQEVIDPADLSVRIMQSYANFTVGGSLSVNGHGRYVGLGPLIHAVKSFKLVLADGSLVDVSPSSGQEIFFGAIGGYGALGVITEATLELTDNSRVRRHTEVLPITAYKQYFFDHVRGRESPVFHSANISPDHYTTVRAVTLSRTADPVTISDRLIPAGQEYRQNRLAFWIATEWPFGKLIQRNVVDPIYFAGEPVTWRNYEASRDVADIEPASRDASTYLLQEYFVPVARFDEFVPQMRNILRRHNVNVVNVSIRHSLPDSGSLLAWARTEVFAFVIYYKQGTDKSAQAASGVWARELIDAALSVGGSYYLPYQLHATEEQFRRAYPRAGEFVVLKQRLDPLNKFRNQLVDKYLRLPAPSIRRGGLTSGRSR
jgi:FAD/FMN-containing dehydrogenase